VIVMPITLSDHVAMPFEAVVHQSSKDRNLGAGFFPWWVKILHAYQPVSAYRAGIEVRGQGSDQRTEVQVTTGSGGKTPDVRGGFNGSHGCDVTLSVPVGARLTGDGVLEIDIVGTPPGPIERRPAARAGVQAPETKTERLHAPFFVQVDCYLPTCFSLISASVLQSTHMSAVGRASSRLTPISTPQDSHQPYSSSSISCRVLSIFLINLRSRSRARSSRLNSSS